jgi:hypothetical protein
MITELHDIAEVTQVVTPAKTILEQVLEIPVGSVVTATKLDHPGGDALVRTGRGGWRSARRDHGFPEGYGGPKDVEAWLSNFEARGFVLTLVSA